MSDYEIKSWNVMSTNNKKFPVIYVTPDETLLTASTINSFALMCKITNTGSIYDGKSIPGVMVSSGEFPNKRPNFFKSTGLYAIQLVCDWHGYPSKNGIVSFAGIKKTPDQEDNGNSPDSIPIPTPKPNPKPKPKPEEKTEDSPPDTSALSTSQIILVAMAILLALIGVLAFTKRS